MSRSDWPFPTRYAPLRTHTSHSVSRLGVRDVPIAGVFGRESALLNGLLLRNILHDVIHSLHKGRYYKSLTWNIQTIWARLVGFGYLTITVYWCTYLLLPC